MGSLSERARVGNRGSGSFSCLNAQTNAIRGANGIELFFLNSLNKEVKKATSFKISHYHPLVAKATIESLEDGDAFVQKEFKNTGLKIKNSRKRIKKLSTID